MDLPHPEIARFLAWFLWRM